MPGSEPIQSVVRTSQVLELLGQTPGGMGVGELASRLGVKPPTLHHLLRTMVQTGLLERTTSPVLYRIGPLLGRIVASTGKADLHAIVSGVMPALAEAFASQGVNCVLAQQLEHDVVVTLRMSADRPGVIQRPAHQTMNGYTSSSALAFQAYWPAAAVEKFRQNHPFEEYNTAWRDLAQLEDYLAQVRKQHYALHLSQDKKRVAVSAPLFDSDRRIIAAIGSSLSGNSAIAIATQKKLVAAVKAAAGQIQQQLGVPAVGASSSV